VSVNPPIASSNINRSRTSIKAAPPRPEAGGYLLASPRSPRPSADQHQPARRTPVESEPIGPRRVRPAASRRGKPHRRIIVVLLALLLAVGAVTWRLVNVQVLDSATYTDWGTPQRQASVALVADRGSIVDRNLNALAVSDDRPTVWIDPALVVDAGATGTALAQILDLDAADITERIVAGGRFMYVKRQIEPEVGAEVLALGLKGVVVENEVTRLLPNGRDFARGVIGRVDTDQIAVTGLELQYDELLTGQAGFESYERGRDGTLLPTGEHEFQAATSGQDLVLTIHRETQWLAEEILIEQVEATEAAGGIAVIMRTGTGEVLASAGVKRDAETGIARPASYNMAYLDVYEPGSVNKVFTISAALEADLVEPDTVFDVPWFYDYADKTFAEPFNKGAGQLTVQEILARSSNIGTIMIAEQVGPQRLRDHLFDLGFGRFTGADGAPTVPDESRGMVSDEFHGTELATIAFGQGVALTPVQVAAAYNTIANQGVYVAPTLVRGTVDTDGELHTWPSAPGRRVMSAETANELTTMLEAVVDHGTGKLAAVDGYQVAGKTGTAQKASEGGYSETDYMSTFVGFVPAEQPQLTILVVLDTTTPRHLAGDVAAPLFSELADYVLQTLRIAPSRPTDPASTDPASTDPASTDGTGTDGTGIDLSQFEEAAARNGSVN
jgi:cell division protein FtsI (penicillin-binding protein 3)